MNPMQAVDHPRRTVAFDEQRLSIEDIVDLSTGKARAALSDAG